MLLLKNNAIWTKKIRNLKTKIYISLFKEILFDCVIMF